MPDLDALSDFCKVIDQWTQAGLPLDQLPAQLWPVIQATHPAARSLRLHTPQTVVGHGEDDTDLALLRLEITPEDERYWLDLGFDPTVPTPQEDTWLQLAARYLSQITTTHQPISNQKNPGTPLHTLIQAEDERDVTWSLLRTLPPIITMVALLRFDRPYRPGEALPTALMTQVTTTRSTILQPAVADYLPEDDTTRAALDELEAGEIHELNIGRDDLFPNILAYLETAGANHYAASGLWVGERLIGVLVLAGDEPITPQVDLGYLQDVLTAMGIMLENYRLRDEALTNQSEARTLYDINRELLATADEMGALRVLHRHLAQDADRLVLIQINRDETGEIVSVPVTATIDEKGEHRPGHDMLEEVGRENLPLYLEEWALQGNNVDFIEDISAIMEERPVSKFSYAYGTRSAIVIPIYEDDQLRQQINIIYRKPRQFDARTRRLYNAIRDQVTVVLANRSLFQETQQTLNEVQALYNINSDLLQASDEADVLQVLHRHLAQDAMSIVLVSLSWDEITDTVTSLVNLCSIVDGQTYQPNRELLGNITEEQLNEMKAEWRLQGQEVDFIEDTKALAAQRPPLRRSYEEGVLASIVMPIYDGEYLVQQINIAFDRPRRFDARTRRLYTAIRNQVAIVLENLRLLQTTQSTAAGLGNQVRVLQTINHLATDLTLVRDEQGLFDKTCEALYSALGVDHVGIALLEPRSPYSRVMSEYPRTGTRGAQLENTPELQERLRTQRQAVIINDTSTSAEISEQTREVLRGAEANAIMLVPILDQNNDLIGTIGLDKFNGRFPSDAAETALAMASQVSVTLQNLRLLKAAQYRAQQMEQVTMLSQIIQSALEVPTLLQVTVYSTGQVIQLDHISILMRDSANERLRVMAWHERDADSAQIDLDGVALDLAGTTAEQVYVKQEALHVDDTEADGVAYTAAAGMRSVIAAPIRSRGVLIGVIEAARERPFAYTNLDLAILQQVANQMSVAFENAQAYTQSQKIAKSKMLVSEITGQLQQYLEVDQIVSVTVQELGKALGARRARIRLDPDLMSGGADDES